MTVTLDLQSFVPERQGPKRSFARTRHRELTANGVPATDDVLSCREVGLSASDLWEMKVKGPQLLRRAMEWRVAQHKPIAGCSQ